MLSQEIIRKLIPFATNENIQKYSPHIDRTLEVYKIASKKQIAMFIAQVTHESGSLRYREEISSGDEYSDRIGLGNTKPEAITIAQQNYTTTGKWFKGRGAIQLTGYDNYYWYGEFKGIDLVSYPFLVAESPELYIDVAGWFWKIKKLNPIAEAGDVRQVTRIINGGYNGLTQRTKFYFENLRILESMLN